jgi:hypothetical protein
MLFEMRFGAVSGPNPDPHIFRITVRINKEAGVGRPLTFSTGGSRRTGGAVGAGEWTSVWNSTNTSFHIPFGKWMNVEVGYKQGNAATGRFYFSVQPEGEAKTVIADVTNWTYHPDAPQPVPLTHSNTLKLYASDDVINHVRNNGGVAQVYWDDLEILKGWPSVSSPDTIAPSVPTSLTATAVSSSQINLSWNASTDNVGVTGYRLERCTGSSCTNLGFEEQRNRQWR